MNAKDLIGKVALRERPVNLRTLKDYSYCSTPVKIIKATDHHIVVEENRLGTHILDERFCDDNWIDYDGLISG